tara:strand:+ start:50 stop:247 length:198 start_codon:yes stop_codon:yes gene_type:complete
VEISTLFCYNTKVIKGETQMVCEVKLIVAGQIFTETVHARDYQDAKRTALARNPSAQVISVNAKV